MTLLLTMAAVPGFSVMTRRMRPAGELNEFNGAYVSS